MDVGPQSIENNGCIESGIDKKGNETKPLFWKNATLGH